jgi:hypothetical protein
MKYYLKCRKVFATPIFHQTMFAFDLMHKNLLKNTFEKYVNALLCLKFLKKIHHFDRFISTTLNTMEFLHIS